MANATVSSLCWLCTVLAHCSHTCWLQGVNPAGQAEGPLSSRRAAIDTKMSAWKAAQSVAADADYMSWILIIHSVYMIRLKLVEVLKTKIKYSTSLCDTYLKDKGFCQVVVKLHTDTDAATELRHPQLPGVIGNCPRPPGIPPMVIVLTQGTLCDQTADIQGCSVNLNPDCHVVSHSLYVPQIRGLHQ